MRRDLDAWAWRGIVNVNTTDATTGATDCAEGRDPLHVHVKYLKLLGTRNACSTEQRLASKMKTHTVWVVITVSYFIFTSAAVHTRSNQPILSVKPQASNVARSLTQPATPTVMPTRQIRPGALGLPDATVFGAVGRWEPVRNDSAGPGRRAAFRSSRRATARGRIDIPRRPPGRAPSACGAFARFGVCSLA